MRQSRELLRNRVPRLGRPLVVTAACLALCAPLAAYAAPGTDDFKPQDDYERMSIAQIEVELARVRTVSDSADIEVRRAAEDVARAQDQLDEAKAASADAARVAKKSRENYEAAREKLSSLAQTVYRSGGSELDSFAPFLQSNGIEEVDRRSRIVENFSRRSDQQMQQVAALDHAALALEAQAKAAEEKVQVAADKVEKQAEVAQAAASAARNDVTAAEQRRESLIKQLANRRQVTIEEERARQERIEADARSRQEAAERARVEANGGNVNAAESQRQAELAGRENSASRDEARRQQEIEDAAAAQAKEEAERAAAAEAARKAAEEERRRKEAEEAATPSPSGAGAAALAWAAQQVGAPYVWGGTGPGYDCSGLVMMAFSHAGVNLPRTADYQYFATTRVSIDNLQPGDLVFYGEGGDPNQIYHVAFYAGNGQILEATHPGDIVRYNPLRYTNLVPYGGRP